ncbi:hypothetical protein ACFWGD_09495 [Corynebacterium sp. NPDC060344]|uniref:hypothetical protein n=1 Tax=Corynebacterium sp. NPDC060344 TaxID=3347101 RepID=UPI00365BCB4C
MSDHTFARQSMTIPADDARGGRRRRKATTVAGAALGALVLAGGGFFAGAAVAGSGDGATDIAYESAFFGSASLGSGSLGSSSGRDEPAPEDGETGAGEDAVDRSADGAGATTADTSEAADADAEAPSPEAGKSSGRTGYAVRGDVVEIEGEDVLVCATGNGLGLSHVGVTLAAGADGEATRAEADRLCGEAFRVMGALVLGDPGGDLLGTSRDITVSDRGYQCRPVAEKVLRCTGDDGSLVTLWSAAP